MTTTADIKALTDQVERDLRDKPVWRLLYTGIGLLALGLLVNLGLAEADPVVTERWDGPAAVAAAVGGIFIAASWVVRILQRGRREEIRQELTRALGAIETERARRDMRMLEIVEPLGDFMRHNTVRIEATMEAVEEMLKVVKQVRAEAYVDAINGVSPVVRLTSRRPHREALSEQDDR